MTFEYLFREFDAETDAEEIRTWLAKAGGEGWEAVGFTSMTHNVGGGLIGGIAIPSTLRYGYTFLLKRAKAAPDANTGAN
jgi:hypothetical protein